MQEAGYDLFTMADEDQLPDVSESMHAASLA
jgi:hypothetical protein